MKILQRIFTTKNKISIFNCVLSVYVQLHSSSKWKWSRYLSVDIPELVVPILFSSIMLTRKLPNIFHFMCSVFLCMSFCPFSFGHCVLRQFFDLRLLIAPLVPSNFSYFQKVVMRVWKLDLKYIMKWRKTYRTGGTARK